MVRAGGLQSTEGKDPTSWSPDGRFILFTSISPLTRFDVWVLPMSGSGKAEPLLQTPFNESGARFSPDGRWISYRSDESGRSEIYVQTFPPSGAKHRVSTNGGWGARWRGDGKELFYLAADGRIASVEVKAGPRLETGAPRVLPVLGALGYAVTADGQRFLVSVQAEEVWTSPVTVVLNWTAALGRK